MINEERRVIQNEAIATLRKNNYNGIFLLPTGSGKSYVLIECLKQLVDKYKYKKIWYLCNSQDLRDRDFPKELDECGASDLKEHIEFMCYQTAYKLIDNKVDIVLADEFDYSLTPEYSKVYKNNTFKHAIFTTAYIDKDKMSFVKDIGIPIIYNKSLQEIEDKKVLNKSRYYFVNFLMSKEERDQYLRYAVQIASLVGELNSLTNNDKKANHLKYRIELAIRARKRFLNALESSAHHCRKLMNDIYHSDKNCKILTFCELTKQADSVCKYTYHNGSEEDNLEKFRNDTIQSLAVCGKINRGVNIKNVRYIIFESCNQSKTQLIQRLGRGKRLDKDDVLNVYFMIPCYEENGKIKYTKIRDWVLKAASNLDLSDAKLYRFKN